MTDTWLIVGLGNPGSEYSGNRHNVGQMVLDELASRIGGKFKVHKSRAQVVEGRMGIGGPRVVLAKPMTYMNVSGGPVSALAKFFDVAPDHVIAVHDEIDIPFNTVKLKIGGGEGGHNGLRDISKALATKDYLRVRVGVGRPPGRMDTADFVLRDFATPEKKDLPFLLDEAADAVELLITEGLLSAQQKHHAARS
ncbi:aminoacyl-tRNA hydrolase [Arthrobacter sp. TES]|jgi:PTH1 family peptidyl-tRNA hydrolase|uniref:Peptidyl-tRNA hydrolase n=1 Tax=Paenarthrobacter ureafaciens TaxID=37931 RepID=A0AAX3ELA1_PAEUR|nr:MULTISPECIES: aminoacyl-tRNA hydrolase [Paenarthrobacter]AOY72204.1 peptidyl-tRNA hydrolase [Arthrobacter sp. ZXY-2]ERI38611.1 peptidyl-tRNA hydrolase [Arthrobacter sp. AK-YN10]NKR11014.1 aminoacyl-tRNA hydrolase [Arthrobacter sp. M5]NKR17471.1 aminoacyl-tRNA hydrolase [Arthrobacter sp. M6]OEH64007.1 aminoacyl-tRNA hydrolase [Arthrobacter sp. D4]OEH64681.1 aminoacyl-tRNA hydrolase [Arthrobacter sp. D2]QOI63912.1 aminoacyl-tRNA hydrolase [Arthrobacter sp. TES]